MVQSTNMLTPYPQQGGANAVSINIYNPQAYGAAPNQPQQAPYEYTNSFYNMPQASAYLPQQAMYPQYIPSGIVNMPTQITEIPQQAYVAPTPQAMPQSIIAPQVEMQEPIAQPEVSNVEIIEPQQVTQVVDGDALVNNLKSPDANIKGETINQIATYAQDRDPGIALQVVSEPIMQALVDIINEDTTGLKGPSPEQIAVAEKIAKGEQLTPEEDILAEQLSPRDLANKNRIFALYTLAMIQKLQRDELNQYIKAQEENGQQPIAPLNIQDLIGYNDIVNVVKNDSRPEVKVAAIQALQHIVEPQDKETIQAVLAEAQKSNDEAVKTAADDAMAQFVA